MSSHPPRHLNERELPYTFQFVADERLLEELEWACADHDLELVWLEEGVYGITVRTVREAFMLGCCLGCGSDERRRRREMMRGPEPRVQ